MAHSLYDIGDDNDGRTDPWLNDRQDRRSAIIPVRLVLIAIVLGVLALVLLYNRMPASGAPSAPATSAEAPTAISTRFALCDDIAGQACILSAGSYAYQGRRYRIADISAPQLNDAACPLEAEQARRGRSALQAMMNGGRFDAYPDPSDSDPRARILMRDGVSLGQLMILKHHARPWSSRPIDWCNAG